jgi:hypothetical protein
MNDTAISRHRRLYARPRGWGALTLLAVGLVGAGSAEATDHTVDTADYVIWRTPSATPDGKQLVISI